MALIRVRLIDLAIVMIGVSMLTFLMIRLIPGDAVAIMLGANSEGRRIASRTCARASGSISPCRCNICTG